VSEALTLLLGSGNKPGALPSYHVVISATLPAWRHGAVETTTLDLAADVQGLNVHLFDRSAVTGQPAKLVEGYIIGEDGYKVVNGKVTTDFFMPLTWSAWQLEVLFPLTIASASPTSAGSEAIDGRTAEVYTLDSANAPPGLLDALSSLTTVKAGRGRLWVDHETGALLKLELTYDDDLVAQAGGPVVAHVHGRVSILVTAVEKVAVALP
jgi:hypothetical protein